MSSISDIIIGVINNMVLGFSAKLPTEYTAISLTDFHSSFSGIATNLSSAYNMIDWLVPAWLIIGIILIIIVAEISLILFKGTILVINIFRGSGA